MSFYDFHLFNASLQAKSPPPPARQTTPPSSSSPTPESTVAESQHSHSAPQNSSTSSSPSPAGPLPKPPPAMAPQPEIDPTEAANAAKLAEAKAAIHPMAKAIPTLRREIERSLTHRNAGKYRNWTASPFKLHVPKWKHLTSAEKPPLLDLLAAAAAHKVLTHKKYDAFSVLVNHRKWMTWAERQMRDIAQRQGINLAEALQSEHPEVALRLIKQESQEEEEEESLLQTMPQVLQPTQQQQPPAHPTQQPQRPANEAEPHVMPKTGQQPQTGVPQQTITTSFQEQTTQSAQRNSQEATRRVLTASAAPAAAPTDHLDKGSVLPVKRSIECPSGPDCPNEPKRLKTRDFGCQVDLEDATPKARQDRPQVNQVLLHAETQQAVTPSATSSVQPAPRREENIIDAVEKLVRSNVNLQQSNRALQQSLQASMHDMAAQNMYWQQRAIMAPPMGYYPQMPDYGMMVPFGHFGQPNHGGTGWRGYQTPHRRGGKTMMGNADRGSVVPEKERAANEASENEAKKADMGKGQSRFFE